MPNKVGRFSAAVSDHVHREVIALLFHFGKDLGGVFAVRGFARARAVGSEIGTEKLIASHEANLPFLLYKYIISCFLRYVNRILC